MQIKVVPFSYSLFHGDCSLKRDIQHRDEKRFFACFGGVTYENYVAIRKSSQLCNTMNYELKDDGFTAIDCDKNGKISLEEMRYDMYLAHARGN